MIRKKYIALVSCLLTCLTMLACGKSGYSSYEIGQNTSGSETYSDAINGEEVNQDAGNEDKTESNLPGDLPDSGGSGGGTPLPTSQINVGDFSGDFYETQTLKDEETGLEVCTVMVPNGWTATLSLNLSMQSCVHPVLAAFTLASSDGNLVIAGFSPQNYIYNYQVLTWGAGSGTVIQEHGDDEEIPSQRAHQLKYRTAAEFVPWYLGKRGLTLNLIGEREINQETFNKLQQETVNDYNEAIQKVGEAYSQAGMTLEGTGVDCSMLDARYQGEINGGTIYLDVLSAGDMASTIVHGPTADYYNTSWDNLYIVYMAAPTTELLDQNRDLFETVFSNSSFSEDFAKFKASWGAELNEKIAANNLEILEDITSYWVEGHLSSTVAQSTEAGYTARMWDEVINSTDTYETTDGGTFTTSSIYSDAVYQNGNEFYVVPSGSNDYPSGWEELSKTHR